jgi:membrane protein DedA with SNARE-associated domain
MVPVFAGVTHQKFFTVAFPVLVASGVWYGALVWLGASAGRNLPSIMGWISNANRLLLVCAGVICVGGGIWWFRTRREGKGEGD